MTKEIITLDQYLTEQKAVLGEMYSSYIEIELKQEHYDAIEAHVKTGGTITRKVFDSLDCNHTWHFNKHYNYRMNKVLN